MSADELADVMGFSKVVHGDLVGGYIRMSVDVDGFVTIAVHTEEMSTFIWQSTIMLKLSYQCETSVIRVKLRVVKKLIMNRH